MRISVYLDTAHAAKQRFENRVVETAQFAVGDPEKAPRPVAGIGDPSIGGHGADWIPNLSTLLAVRGNRWLTVTYANEALSRPQRLEAASALAHRAFRLSAHGR